MGLAAALGSNSKAVVYPQREIVAVADRAYASLKLLDRCRSLSNPITFITTRLRLDAALYESAPPRRPGQRWTQRKTSSQRRALAKPFSGSRGSEHRLEAHHDR